MAQRRMFSLEVCDTDNFLDMPASTQLLYFHLGLRADDDGFVSSPKKITAMVNCSTDDLKLLIAKQFVIPFQSGVCVIRDWKVNNYIQKDRYHETRYLAEKSMLTICEDQSYMLDTERIQDVSKMDTEVRLVKSKGRLELGKESKGADEPLPPPTVNFGPELNAAFNDWLDYKREKRQAYKPKGLQSLMVQIEKQVAIYGESAVAALIVECMSNGWQGIIWDKLEKQPRNGGPGRNVPSARKSWAELARELEGSQT